MAIPGIPALYFFLKGNRGGVALGEKGGGAGTRRSGGRGTVVGM